MNRTTHLFVGLAALAVPLGLFAQQRGDPDDPWCDENGGSRNQERYCEVREFTVSPDGGTVVVDGGPNGGISVEGWDRNEIQVRAKVQAWTRDGDDPEDLVSQIRIETGGTIRADGPDMRGGRSRDAGWAVNFELMVPARSDLALETVNGGIEIANVSGAVEFRAVNGGIRLAAVSGDVSGRTTNGGLQVDLEGDRWDGAGLDVETTNGGVELSIPADYQAELTTGTVNGGFEIDFPITIQGRINRRRITTELNGGGPPIRVVTTNGGVTVRRR